MELTEGVKAYTLTDVVGDTLIFTQHKRIVANNPYVVVADEDIALQAKSETTIPVIPRRLTQATAGDFVMSGTLTSISKEDAEKQCLYALNEDASSWNKIMPATKSIQVIYPYHAYVQDANPEAPSSMQMRLVEEDLPTGVTDIEITEEKMDNIIYDLQGRRVYETQNGKLYIVNNKKVIFK